MWKQSRARKRKLKNSYGVLSALKNKYPSHCKRFLFYTSSQRKQDKDTIKKEYGEL